MLYGIKAVFHIETCYYKLPIISTYGRQEEDAES